MEKVFVYQRIDTRYGKNEISVYTSVKLLTERLNTEGYKKVTEPVVNKLLQTLPEGKCIIANWVFPEDNMNTGIMFCMKTLNKL